MLPPHFKLTLVNDCGQNITSVTLQWTPYKWASGGPSYGTTITPLTSNINSGSSSQSTAIDNTSALNAGAHFVLQATTAGATSGDQQLRLYCNSSVDGTTYDTQNSVLIAAISCTVNGAGVWAGEWVP